MHTNIHMYIYLLKKDTCVNMCIIKFYKQIIFASHTKWKIPKPQIAMSVMLAKGIYPKILFGDWGFFFFFLSLEFWFNLFRLCFWRRNKIEKCGVVIKSKKICSLCLKSLLQQMLKRFPPNSNFLRLANILLQINAVTH